MPGRNFTSSTAYRYGFNGKEKDDELTQGDYDFDQRMYDSRLGRFLSIDPLSTKFAYNSPYLFAGNTPIEAVDLNGEKIYFVNCSMNLLKAFKTLIKTPSGRALLTKYAFSNKQDVYIAVSKDFRSSAKDIADGSSRAVALTIENSGTFLKDGKIAGISKAYTQAAKKSGAEGDFQTAGDYEEASSAFKSFEGVDVSKSTGRKVSLIVFNENELSKFDDYENAEAIFHEGYAHLELPNMFPGIDATTQHELYGNQYVAKPATPGTAGEQIQNELGKVKKSDESKKVNPDKTIKQ